MDYIFYQVLRVFNATVEGFRRVVAYSIRVIEFISFHALVRFNLGLSWTVGFGRDRTKSSSEPLQGCTVQYLSQDKLIASLALFPSHSWLDRIFV